MPGGEALARFAADLDPLVAPGDPFGIAVSGGPDSVGLLLLAAAARPGAVFAASVDHSLRAGSRAEAEGVAAICATLGVPHDILTLSWPAPPASALQRRARDARYGALGEWARHRGLARVATGHHADDQAETLLMRLTRGAGVRGLAAMRPAARMPGAIGVSLVRPLLGWRRDELAAIVAEAGIAPVDDPSNHDDRHERVRMRALLRVSPWLDCAAVARSADHLADADEAIEYAVDAEWRRVVNEGDTLCYAPQGVPAELRRRLVARIVATMASEGDGQRLRGREVDQMMRMLDGGGSATLRGVVARGGTPWRFTRAAPRHRA